MKYIISESKLEKLMVDYFDEVFPVHKINWTYPYEEFEDGTEGEDPNRIEFYIGDWGDDNTLFRWYACEYFNRDSFAQSTCPEIAIDPPYGNLLVSLFGDRWENPFKKWFTDNFNLKVKTVSSW